jgi:predicted transcriptional regulator
MAVNGESGGLLGPLEAEVMEVMWAAGAPLSVRAVLDELNGRRRQPLAYTTVMTVMARLAEKDVLHRTKDGRGYLYEPAVGNEAGIAVRDVIRDFGESALASFVEQARADPKLLKRLERLMRQQK